MGPLVSHVVLALIYSNSSTIISIFAVVILSILGSLFSRNHHMVMGSDEDPENGGAVAASIFIAVAVYAVRH